jgi:hypothetical protein
MPSTPKHEARTSIVRSGHQGPDGRCRLADQRAASADIASMHVTTRRLKASERLEGLMPNLAGRSVEREQWRRGYQPVSCARNLLNCVSVQVILQQADSAWVPAHPFPSTADLAALHAKANWLTVPVADQQRCSGTAIFVRTRIFEAQHGEGRTCESPRGRGRSIRSRRRNAGSRPPRESQDRSDSMLPYDTPIVYSWCLAPRCVQPSSLPVYTVARAAWAHHHHQAKPMVPAYRKKVTLAFKINLALGSAARAGGSATALARRYVRLMPACLLVPLHCRKPPGPASAGEPVVP